jgi:diguanylate cyclase (GGDEF)-like protein
LLQSSPSAPDPEEQLRAELPKALATGDLVAFFQPEIDLDTGSLCGAEALVRWMHPSRGVLAPGQFLHLVDELGFGRALTRVVLDAALTQHQLMANSGFVVPMSVNVPPDLLADTTFPDLVAERLARHGVDAKSLVLEITEHASVDTWSPEVIARLATMGVQLSLDDFGTGYSSLERLGALRVQTIKLDMSLVRPILDNLNIRKIVELSIEMAHQLGARVVAEGVESDAVKVVLASLGCDMAQGFAFARPMSGQQFLAWTREHERVAHRRRGESQAEVESGPGQAVASEPSRQGRDLAAGIVASLRRGIDAVGARALTAMLVLLFVYGLWQFGRWGGKSHQALIGDLSFVPVNGAGIVAAFRASRRRDLGTRTCRAWTLLACALAAYMLGDLLQGMYEVVLHERGYPTWADASYLCFYALAIAGIMSFPSRRLGRGERTRSMLDMATIFTGGAAVIWYIVIAPAMSAADGFNLANVVVFAYPLGDLMLLFGVINLLFGGVPPVNVTALRVFAFGLTAFIVTDICYDWVIVHGGYLGGDPVDSGWMVALAMMFLAANCQRRTSLHPHLADPLSPSKIRISRLPYVAVAGGYALLGWVGLTHLHFNPLGGLIIAAAILTALVSARQLIALRDNSQLVMRYHYLAAIDGLTGLYNRRHFLEIAEQQFAQAARFDRPLSMLMLDIDFFKQINDHHGHAGGDEVLANAARLCRLLTRPADICARYGGDELVILLPGETAESALQPAERILGALTHLQVGSGDDHRPITMSIGIAEAAGCRNIEALLARADLALYQAKRSGRARASVFSQNVEPAPALV